MINITKTKAEIGARSSGTVVWKLHGIAQLAAHLYTLRIAKQALRTGLGKRNAYCCILDCMLLPDRSALDGTLDCSARDPEMPARNPECVSLRSLRHKWAVFDPNRKDSNILVVCATTLYGILEM